jgi:cobalt-zinc-cadmium efflux system protein
MSLMGHGGFIDWGGQAGNDSTTQRLNPSTTRRLNVAATSQDCIAPPEGTSTRRLWFVLGITGLVFLVEAVGGWLAGSLALLADAGHMLTDLGAISLSLFSSYMARRPADVNKTYGYLRWEILAALINGAALFGIAIWVVVEAISRLGDPSPIRTGLFLGVASIGLVANLVSLALLHRHSAGSLNARGVYLHVMSDALGSLSALIAALIIVLTGWVAADPIVSILLSLLILRGAWRLVRESTDVLLEAVPPGVDMQEVRGRMLEVDGVSAVHDLHVWTVGSGLVAMSGHAVVPDLARHPDVLEELRVGLRDLGISHVTVQVEMTNTCATGAA